MAASIRGEDRWKLFEARNRVFDAFARDVLNRWLQAQPPRVIFAYSYACTKTFKLAIRNGCSTVLGQIDGGPQEERLVEAEHSRYPGLQPTPARASPSYWDDWRQQCELATTILVNSPWSRRLLVEAGIDDTKIAELPLYVEPVRPPTVDQRAAFEFSARRPMRVLFLGQFNLRKGAARLLDAVRLLSGENVEFWVVGSVEIVIPKDLVGHPKLRLIGPVPRSDVLKYYQFADVFLLPTISDGYAITQLEAQAVGLPIVASRYCGSVVRDGINGVLLGDVEPTTIARALKSLVNAPSMLWRMRAQPYSPFSSIEDYGRALISLDKAQSERL